jgi:8-oxo-dGTP pyrophosphatase MutT (NUDIX family)
MNDSSNDKNIRTLEQVSAGGVVFRINKGSAEVAIVRIVPEMRWQLPKGIIDPGETIEEAALREVREESGIVADLVAPIETIEYWFVADRNGERIRYHKFVHFFLMSYKAGDVADHDHEVDEARWVDIETAVEMLEFKSERDVVTKAAAMIAADIHE